MKRSQKIALLSLALGIVAAILVQVFLFPNMTWLGFVIIALGFGGFIYANELKTAAREKIIDRD